MKKNPYSDKPSTRAKLGAGPVPHLSGKEKNQKKNWFISLDGNPILPRKKSAGFIVFEGIDGSGKSTQLKLLSERFKRCGYNVVVIDFPQYGKKSAGLVEEYLSGKYGSSMDVGPYRASIFYACDRYDASFQIRKRLKQNKIVISDRYFASNAAHQGGKIKDKKERAKFLKWLYYLEYEIFNIPKPNFNIILKTPPKIAQMLVGKIKDKKKIKKKSFLGNEKRDIHEKDLSHLVNAEKAYLEIAKKFPKDFLVIDSIKNNKLLSPKEINEEVWRVIKKICINR